jgi:hypothetical protein
MVGEVEDTLLSVVVVTHLADSPAVALVRDSAGRGDFLLVDFLVAEIAVAGISMGFIQKPMKARTLLAVAAAAVTLTSSAQGLFGCSRLLLQVRGA